MPTILRNPQVSFSALWQKLRDAASHLKVEDFSGSDDGCPDITNEIMSTGTMWLNAAAHCLDDAPEFFCCFSPQTHGANTDLDPKLLWDKINNKIPPNTKHTLVFVKVIDVERVGHWVVVHFDGYNGRTHIFTSIRDAATREEIIKIIEFASRDYRLGMGDDPVISRLCGPPRPPCLAPEITRPGKDKGKNKNVMSRICGPTGRPHLMGDVTTLYPDKAFWENNRWVFTARDGEYGVDKSGRNESGVYGLTWALSWLFLASSPRGNVKVVIDEWHEQSPWQVWADIFTSTAQLFEENQVDSQEKLAKLALSMARSYDMV